MDRARLADFLRSRRDSLQPEQVGLPRGGPRRTPGLRRDEVAELSGISTDYYTRLEQPRGPLPSEQVLAALARGLRLTTPEQHHLFRLAGYAPPVEVARDREVGAALQRVFHLLQDKPALVVNELGETLLQTPSAVALLGDETSHRGLARVRAYRWFVDPAARRRTPVDDHGLHSRALVAQLASATARGPRGSRAEHVVQILRHTSAEFAGLWDEQLVAPSQCEAKRFVHELVGELELHGETLLEPEHRQSLTVFTAEAGSLSEHRLRALTEAAPRSAFDQSHAQLVGLAGR
ncbi:helix-turn-helix transcriptional regulator [Alloalcanivorax gelatiniphagus]